MKRLFTFLLALTLIGVTMPVARANTAIDQDNRGRGEVSAHLEILSTPKPHWLKPYLQDPFTYCKGIFSLTGPDLSLTILGDRYDWPSSGGDVIDAYVQALVDSGNFSIVDIYNNEEEYGGWNPYSIQGKTHYRFYEVALEYNGMDQPNSRLSMAHGNKTGHVIISYGFKNNDVQTRLKIQYVKGIELIDLGYRYGSAKPVFSPASSPIPHPTATPKPVPAQIPNPQFTAFMRVGESRTFTFNGIAPDYEKLSETFQWNITIGTDQVRVENANSRTCTVVALKPGIIQLDCTYIYTSYGQNVLTGNREYVEHRKAEGYTITIER